MAASYVRAQPADQAKEVTSCGNEAIVTRFHGILYMCVYMYNRCMHAANRQSSISHISTSFQMNMWSFRRNGMAHMITSKTKQNKQKNKKKNVERRKRRKKRALAV